MSGKSEEHDENPYMTVGELRQFLQRQDRYLDAVLDSPTQRYSRAIKEFLAVYDCLSPEEMITRFEGLEQKANQMRGGRKQKRNGSGLSFWDKVKSTFGSSKQR